MFIVKAKTSRHGKLVTIGVCDTWHAAVVLFDATLADGSVWAAIYENTYSSPKLAGWM